MKYIYNPTVKELKRKYSDEVYLSYLESKLVEALLNNDLCTYEEISNYVYGFYDKTCRNLIRQIKKRLLKKVKLKIKNVVGVRF